MQDAKNAAQIYEPASGRQSEQKGVSWANTSTQFVFQWQSGSVPVQLSTVKLPSIHVSVASAKRACVDIPKQNNSPLFNYREEIPPEEDQREEAAHEGVDRQAAAVGHLEDGERILRVCAGAVPVRQGTCCTREGRGALPAGTELLL